MADRYVLDGDGCGSHCRHCGDSVCSCNQKAEAAARQQEYVRQHGQFGGATPREDSPGRCGGCGSATGNCTCWPY